MNDPFSAIRNPVQPAIRPHVLINMVSTIDGKTLTGNRGEAVMDLGSKEDHRRMRELQDSVDAVMIGSGSLRATKGIWYPSPLWRFVVTTRGGFDPQSRFFTDAPEKARIVTTTDREIDAPPGIQILGFGTSDLDFAGLLAHMVEAMGIQRLLIEGGSELNASLLRLGLVDELYLTLAPKIKLGRDVPTYAGGEPLERHQVQDYDLVSCEPVGNEVFLRYVRHRNEPVPMP